jgi:hypothetical protein
MSNVPQRLSARPVSRPSLRDPYADLRPLAISPSPGSMRSLAPESGPVFRDG